MRGFEYSQPVILSSMLLTTAKLPLEFCSWADTPEGFGVATAVVPKADVHRPDQVEVLIALIVKYNCP